MKVKCIHGHLGAALEEGRIYKVVMIVIAALVVPDGSGKAGRHESGYILDPIDAAPMTWPYVWDKDRFEVVDE